MLLTTLAKARKESFRGDFFRPLCIRKTNHGDTIHRYKHGIQTKTVFIKHGEKRGEVLSRQVWFCKKYILRKEMTRQIMCKDRVKSTNSSMSVYMHLYTVYRV